VVIIISIIIPRDLSMPFKVLHNLSLHYLPTLVFHKSQGLAVPVPLRIYTSVSASFLCLLSPSVLPKSQLSFLNSSHIQGPAQIGPGSLQWPSLPCLPRSQFILSYSLN
jgi:hypothetical protein